jgi:hypothetical protein
MKTKRLGILGVIAILPAFAQVSSAPSSMETPSPRQHRPIRDRVDHGDGTTTSSNWSGYAVLGTSFTSAKGSWTVPPATCISGDQYAAFWVGIDGYETNSDTVEQTGTDSDCDGRNPSYYAWYEFYPKGSFNIGSLTIKPGDEMSASVTYNGSEFTITIEDVTTGKSFTKSETVSSAKRSSAEWIAEAPSSEFSVLPLADFGTVLFGKDSTGVSGTNEATDSSTSGDIGSFSTIEQINMAKKNKTKEATTSGLSGDGTSFSVLWISK